MSKSRICDENLEKLYKAFKKEYGRKPSTTSYNELKKTLCAIMTTKKEQNTLEDEKLKIQTEISNINHKEYISGIALAISVLSVATSFFFSFECCLFIFIGFVLGFIAVGGGLWALFYHNWLVNRILYYEFKLKCIEEVEKKEIKHISVVKVYKR